MPLLRDLSVGTVFTRINLLNTELTLKDVTLFVRAKTNPEMERNGAPAGAMARIIRSAEGGPNRTLGLWSQILGPDYEVFPVQETELEGLLDESELEFIRNRKELGE